MIYTSYTLSTLKNLAKQLKRILRQSSPSVSTMDCLDIVAKAHNANDWNHLYKTHKVVVESFSKLGYGSFPSDVFFVEDLSFKARMKFLEEVVGRMQKLGVPVNALGDFANKVMSNYAPMWSHFFQNEIEAEGVLTSLEYTSFKDMYGSLFLASASQNTHTSYLIKEVIPECLKHGGLLMLTAEEYSKCEHLLNGDETQTIHLGSKAPLSCLSWSENATIDDFESFYYNGFLGVGDFSMFQGRAACFFEAFFKLWRAIGIDELPVEKITSFEPKITEVMLAKNGVDSVAIEGMKSVLNHTLQVNADSPGWSSKLSQETLCYWEHLVKSRDSIHHFMMKSNNEKKLMVDSLFNDFSKVTVVVCDGLSGQNNNPKNRGPWIEEGVMVGVLSLLSNYLKKRKCDRLLLERPMPKYVLYTSPNSISVQIGFSEMIVENGPYLKVVNSVLVAPNKSSGVCISPDSLELDSINTYGFDYIEHATLKYQADHVLDLNLMKY